MNRRAALELGNQAASDTAWSSTTGIAAGDHAVVRCAKALWHLDKES